MLLSLLALAVAVLSCRHAGWIGSRRRILEARMSSEGRWTLLDAAGRELTAKLAPQTRITSTFVWLHWRGEFGTRQMLLARNPVRRQVPDAIHGREDWRRLIVGVRWAAPQAALSRDVATPLLGADRT